MLFEYMFALGQAEGFFADKGRISWAVEYSRLSSEVCVWAKQKEGAAVSLMLILPVYPSHNLFCASERSTARYYIELRNSSYLAKILSAAGSDAFLVNLT